MGPRVAGPGEKDPEEGRKRKEVEQVWDPERGSEGPGQASSALPGRDLDALEEGCFQNPHFL